jgi:hypothetical protein
MTMPRFSATCSQCGNKITANEKVLWMPATRTARHAVCPDVAGQNPYQLLSLFARILLIIAFFMLGFQVELTRQQFWMATFSFWATWLLLNRLDKN